MIKEPNLKSMAAELDQQIELLGIHELQKHMLRDAALKAVVAAMTEGQTDAADAKLLHRILLAFHSIHRTALAGDRCQAERLLEVASIADHNTMELAKLMPEVRQFLPPTPEPGEDHGKSGG